MHCLRYRVPYCKMQYMQKKFKVIRAEVLGYCMGVKMAVEAVYRALKESPLRPVYTYGQLIHNPIALKRLKERGVEILDPLSQAKKGGAPLPENFGGRTVVIRAHGIPPLELRELEKRGAEIVDATCPRVITSQRLAQKFYSEGIAVILAGDKNHAEITGIEGFAPGCAILESAEEAEAFVRSSRLPDRAALIGQTTIRQTEYDSIAKILSTQIASLRVCPTICPATEQRQAALAQLAPLTDGIIVIGGKTSANTQRLFAAAKSLVSHAWLVESAEEIPDEAFSFERLGLAAGASTPDETIDSVEKRLLSFVGECALMHE